MDTTCNQCGSSTPPTVFCSVCGKVLDRAVLKSVRLMGFDGVRHSTSPKIDEFWNTGDPQVFDHRP